MHQAHPFDRAITGFVLRLIQSLINRPKAADGVGYHRASGACGSAVNNVLEYQPELGTQLAGIDGQKVIVRDAVRGKSAGRVVFTVPFGHQVRCAIPV